AIQTIVHLLTMLGSQRMGIRRVAYTYSCIMANFWTRKYLVIWLSSKVQTPNPVETL
ncbi:hypothetical protein ACJX0J_038503, partial [Zea mays]